MLISARKRLELASNIAVFTTSEAAPRPYVEHARRMGELIGGGNFNLVYGGIDRGLMHEVAVSAKDRGALISGVLPLPTDSSYFRVGNNSKLLEINDHIVHDGSVEERTRRMLRVSRAAVVLAGGLETLSQATMAFQICLRDRRFCVDASPPKLVVVNTEGYYDGLRSQLDHVNAEGFGLDAVSDVVHFAPDPVAAMGYIEALEL